jgi:hypothetical protein
MYFGWVTPALMILIFQQLHAQNGKPLPPVPTAGSHGRLHHRRRHLLSLSSSSAIARPPIGGRLVPLSVIAAGFNVLGWYAFAWLYRRYSRDLPRTLSRQMWDTAVFFLLFASLGGWGLPLLTLLGVENALLSMAFTHLFLDSFADGWFVLAVLGLIYAQLPHAARHPWARAQP